MDLDILKRMSLVPGSVFRMELFPEDGVTPKNDGDVSRNKYFVVLGIDNDSILVGSVLINSEINSSLIRVIAPYQHCIYPEDYEFLNDKFRYVDCFLIKELPFERILSSADYIGIINEADMSKIKELAVMSPANRPNVLKRYGLM